MVEKVNKRLSISSHKRNNEHERKHRNLSKKLPKRKLNEKEAANYKLDK